MANATLVAVLASFGLLAGLAQEYKSVKEAMSATHKGKESIAAKAGEGKASEDEVKKLIAVYEFMAGQKPAMGDAEAFKTKVDALIAAAKELAEKKDGAAAKFKAAVNCKACHDAHKPKK
jgi:hypothetical protein